MKTEKLFGYLREAVTKRIDQHFNNYLNTSSLAFYVTIAYKSEDLRLLQK